MQAVRSRSWNGPRIWAESSKGIKGRKVGAADLSGLSLTLVASGRGLHFPPNSSPAPPAALRPRPSSLRPTRPVSSRASASPTPDTLMVEPAPSASVRQSNTERTRCLAHEAVCPPPSPPPLLRNRPAPPSPTPMRTPQILLKKHVHFGVHEVREKNNREKQPGAQRRKHKSGGEEGNGRLRQVEG